MEYADWVEENLESLQEGFIEYLKESRDNELFDYVFFWDNDEKRVEKLARDARESFERYCQSCFEQGLEPEREDVLGCER